MQHLKNKRVLITGACGTIGSELVHQLLTHERYSLDEVIGLDNNENALFFLDQQHFNDERAHFYLVDIRDYQELRSKMKGIDIVFHAAALKHVILSERSPEQAVNTNILGVQNVIGAAWDSGVEKVIFTSSDKAVNPTNVMGTSKLMGERLMTAANSNKRDKGPVFASTRFGNVLGSNGSVVPIFHNQIAKGGPVTLTHPDMTRFVMSISDAVRLVLDSASLARGGEVFITKMPVVRIIDLATAMIADLAPVYGNKPEDIRIKEIGAKPGEKLYEELMNQEETRRALELPRYFVVLPAFRGIYKDITYDYPEVLSSVVDNPYISKEQHPMSVSEIQTFMKKNNLIKSSYMQ
jgi:FlaA1/EpsC-like NDP-sugar epimerase